MIFFFFFILWPFIDEILVPLLTHIDYLSLLSEEKTFCTLSILKGIFFIEGSFWSWVWKCVKHKGRWYSLILGMVHYFVLSFVIKFVSLLQILCLHRKYFLFSKNKYFSTPFFWKRTFLIIYVGSILNCNWGLALINPGGGVFVAVGFLIKVFMLIKAKGLAFWIYIVVFGTRKFQWKSYCGSYGQQGTFIVMINSFSYFGWSFTR